MNNIHQNGNAWFSFGDFVNELEGTMIVGVDMAKWLKLKTGSLEHCMNGVEVYFNAVKHFSMNYYEQKPAEHCNMNCAKVMGDPTIGIQNE